MSARERDAVGRWIPEAGVRRRMAESVLALAELHEEASAGEASCTVTMVGETLVATANGSEATEMLSALVALLGVVPNIVDVDASGAVANLPPGAVLRPPTPEGDTGGS